MATGAVQEWLDRICNATSTHLTKLLLDLNAQERAGIIAVQQDCCGVVCVGSYVDRSMLKQNIKSIIMHNGHKVKQMEYIKPCKLW